MHIADRTDRRRQPQPNVMGIISRAPLLVLLVAGCSYVTGTLATEADKTSVPPLRVVAISGGTRGASCNSGLVRYVVSAAPSIAPRIEITVLDVSSWPLFNSDLISTVGVPADIKAGMSLVAHAHGVIIATPEYNWALAPGTTNAVAWLSQMSGRSSPVAPLASKPCGLLSAGGALGGSRAQLQARNSFTVFLNMPTMAKPEVAVRIFGDPTPFDLVTGNLTLPVEQQRVDAWLAAYEKWVIQHVYMHTAEVPSCPLMPSCTPVPPLSSSAPAPALPSRRRWWWRSWRSNQKK